MELLFIDILKNIKIINTDAEQKKPNIDKIEHIEIKPIKNTSTKYVKKFKENNKEKIKEKITCDVCLSTYTYFNKYTHFKTKRHLTFLNKLNI